MRTQPPAASCRSAHRLITAARRLSATLASWRHRPCHHGTAQRICAPCAPWSALPAARALRRHGSDRRAAKRTQPAPAAEGKPVARGTLDAHASWRNDTGASGLSPSGAGRPHPRAHGAARLRAVRAGRDCALAAAVADLARGSSPGSHFPLKPIVQIPPLRDNSSDDLTLLVGRHQAIDLVELI